jgi:catechol 2,3-dioxygenase-like lactoylglutathione lyase family enzyme
VTLLGISHVGLLVRDYDEAKNFYCDKLGFTVAEDTTLAGGKRWVCLAAPGQQGSELLLSKAVGAAQQASIGNQAGGRVLFFIRTDCFDSDYQLFRSRGVEFVEDPRKEAYGSRSGLCRNERESSDRVNALNEGTTEARRANHER